MATFPRDRRVKDQIVWLFFMLCIYVIVFSNILPEFKFCNELLFVISVFNTFCQLLMWKPLSVIAGFLYIYADGT